MNVDNQTILHVKGGHLPPDDLLQLLLEKVRPNAFGFSVQNIHEGKPDLSITREDATGMAISDLKRLFVNAKDFPLSVYLARLQKNYHVDDIQPFLINDGDGNPFIAIYTEGTLNGHDDPKEHTEHYNYVNGILIPKIVEWCEDFDGDLEKIAKKLTGDVFNKEFMMHVGHRGILHIMPCDGDTINLGKNELASEPADWGWVSQRHVYDDAKPAAAPAAAEPSKRRFWGGKTAETKVEAQPVIGKDGKPVHDAGTPMSQQVTPPKKEGAAPQIAARPPSWCHKNDDVKMWYKIVGGVSQAAWKKRVPCIVTDFEAVKIDNLEDFKAYALKKTLETTGGTQTSAGTPPAATAAADVKVISGVHGDKEFPIIGPKKLEELLDMVAKYIDNNSKVIPDPKEMQAIENPSLSFAASLGLKPVETINWPKGFLLAIAQKDPAALVEYAFMWRSLARPHVLAAAKVEDEKTKHVLAHEELKPAPKKSGFWGGKTAA